MILIIAFAVGWLVYEVGMLQIRREEAQKEIQRNIAKSLK